MKLLSVMILFVLTAVTAQAAPNNFDSFLTNFNYETRADMKIDSKRLIELLTQRKAVLIDIRFPEETRAWKMGFGHYIPLNELPKRLGEIPKDKLIVVACPHKDRSAIAMAYLRSNGYNARYLTDGLIGLAENLRGDAAKEFQDEIQSINK